MLQGRPMMTDATAGGVANSVHMTATQEACLLQGLGMAHLEVHLALQEAMELVALGIPLPPGCMI